MLKKTPIKKKEKKLCISFFFPFSFGKMLLHLTTPDAVYTGLFFENQYFLSYKFLVDFWNSCKKNNLRGKFIRKDFYLKKRGDRVRTLQNILEISASGDS